MSKWKYSHPEGIHAGMNYTDWKRWPLARYVHALENETVLNQDIREAHKEASLRASDSLDGEKWTLRFRGLELLRDVDNDVDMG